MSGIDTSGLSPRQIAQLKHQELILHEKKLKLIEGLPHRYGFKWYPWAREFYESTNKMNLLVAANQISKPVLMDTDIPTPNGFKKMRDICIGDYVFDRNGDQVRVIDIPYIGIEKSYEVIFNDGSRVICGGSHDWICKGYRERFRKKYNNHHGGYFKNLEFGKWSIRSLNEIILKGKYSPTSKPIDRFSIPVACPIKYQEIDLFDPYFVGLFIGNGSNRSITFNSADLDLAGQALLYGNKIKTKKLVISVTGEAWQRLCILGLDVPSYEKQIPIEYLMGSVVQRKELLAGLMDTDGMCSKNGQNYNYCTTSEALALQVRQLVASLGGICHIKKYPSYYMKDGVRTECRDHFVVTLWTEFNPFKSVRKSSRWKLNNRYRHERIIVRINPLGDRRMKCITVDNADGSFLCTKDYIVTHNSSTQIRKAIEWATNKNLWPKLWKTEPRQFWYLYPSKEVATVEFEKKWITEFLPRGEFKKGIDFGWREEYVAQKINALHFNSGVSIYYKTYAQDPQSLQTSTAHAIFSDEELPFILYPELMMRMAATDGYFHMVFTATLNQPEWRQAMEGTGKDEKFPDAWKRCVSMYDCQFYEDGSPGAFSEQRIEQIKAMCGSETEVQRRVMGRFVTSEGRTYPAFEPEKHYVKEFKVRSDHRIYGAVDPGGGGQHGSPTAIAFLAVEPDLSKGTIFRCWRGDRVSTTAGDALEKYRELKGNLNVLGAVYDFSAKDFGTIAQRIGESFTKAEKNHEMGEGMVNTLFRNNMLFIVDDDDGRKLGNELQGLMKSSLKRTAYDDLADCVRYLSILPPWDFSKVKGLASEVEKTVESRPLNDAEYREWELKMRRGEIDEREESIEDEFDFWNEQY